MPFVGKYTFTPGEVFAAADANQIVTQSISLLLSDQAGTAYTIGTADIGRTLRFTSASNVTVTLGTAATFGTGERVDILRDGAGTVTLTAGSGVTIAGIGTAVTGTAAAFKVGTQYSGFTVLNVGANTYRVMGDVVV